MVNWLCGDVLRVYLTRIERDAAGTPVKLYLFTRARQADESKWWLSILMCIRPSCPRGDRHPTAVIADRYKAGESIQALAEDYERPPRDIEEAIRCELHLQGSRIDPLIFFPSIVASGKHIVADALRHAGAWSRFTDDHFPQDVHDVEWLRDVGPRGWIVLARDDRIGIASMSRQRSSKLGNSGNAGAKLVWPSDGRSVCTGVAKRCGPVCGTVSGPLLPA